MKKINLSAKKTIHSFYKESLNDPNIKKIYNLFKKNIKKSREKNFSVAVSGGLDSLALVFLSKCLSIEMGYKFYYYHVDHRLRSNSNTEANYLKKKLKKFDIDCKILTIKNKIIKNIQSEARNARYNILFNQNIKKKINNIVTAHNIDDVIENFFIRLQRGSGLKGLSSFLNASSNINKNSNSRIIRPLLDISKLDLEYVTKKSYDFCINDPSNDNEKFLRVRIRKMIKELENEGLSFKNYKLSLEALNKSNEALEFYVKDNISQNSKYFKSKGSIVLGSNFFNQPDDIVFRSLSNLVLSIGNKNTYPRGKKMIKLVEMLKKLNFKNKLTLSGCVFKKVENTVIISREI